MNALLLALLWAAAPARAADDGSLGFSEAVELAVKNNLQTALAAAGTEEARGQALQSAARLLPNLFGTAFQTRTFKENLAALGFPSFQGFGPLIGPFNTFDARVQLALTLFDLSSIRRYQASRLRTSMAQSEEALAREQVAAAAGLAYVEALRADEASAAAQADLELAQALQSLAEEKHDAGMATGIDVVRARTRASEAHLKLLQVEASKTEAYLRLKRVSGLPLGTPVVLTDFLDNVDGEPPKEEPAVQSALETRLELKIAGERLDSDRADLKAARGQYLPSLSASANYGLSGPLPDSGARTTSQIGAALSLPLWTGGELKGRVEAADASVRRSEAVASDVKAQVEEDVRLALETLETAVEQVKTSDEAEGLAEEELDLARDRFQAGEADNIELVDAQDVLARSRDSQLAALSQYNVARINLALAMGRMGAFQL